MYGYIYKTENKSTGKVYIGKKTSSIFNPNYHGSGKYIKEDIKKYGKDNFITTLLCSAESEDELNKSEINHIAMYKDLLGDTCINQAIGGTGGDSFKYANNNIKDDFIKIMTDINNSRCKSDEFRKQASERLKKKYEDPKEREKQSEKIKESWSSEILRHEQSIRLKNYYKNNPKDNSYNNKKCAIELNGIMKEFDSRKDLKNYLKSEYNVYFTNPEIKKMIDSNEIFNPTNRRKEEFFKISGMKLFNLDKV